MKPGDVTNFGTVKEIGDAFISFKARDTGVTKIALNQRKMGSKDFVLDKLIKLKEETEIEEDNISETPDSSPMSELNKVRASIKGFEAKLKMSPNNEDLVKMLKNLRTKETMLKKQLGVKEDTELDEAKGADPANLRSIIANHTKLLSKATTPDAKDFHKVAIANAKEKLSSLGEETELEEAFDPNIIRITNLTGSKLEAFFLSLSDGFMDIYDDDSSQVNAKTLAENLRKLSKLAKNVN